MKLHRLVQTSLAVAATRSRNAKRDALAEVIRAMDGEELPIGVAYLSGILPQGRVGVGPAAVRDSAAVPPAPMPSLSLTQAHAAIERVRAPAGPGSAAARRAALRALFGRCVPDELRFLIRLLVGELRQGALDGVMVEAIAKAARCSGADVRRAYMLRPDLPLVATVAMRDGAAALRSVRLSLGTPIQSMLAQTADDVGGAVDALQTAVLDYKMDGARVQVHKAGTEVAVFSRQHNDVSSSVPEVVEAVVAMPASSLVLDGEVIGFDGAGRLTSVLKARSRVVAVTARHRVVAAKCSESRRYGRVASATSAPLAATLSQSGYERGRMKRNPGGWLRERLLDRVIAAALLAILGTGWLCGAGLALWMVFGTRLFSEWNNWIVLLPGAGVLVAALYKAKLGWRLPDMRKGAHAEETIGQAIEYALTRDGCAVAHHVEEIAQVGDIDHLVATPQGLWVIETKYGRVPRSEFAETLRRIARNVEGVRVWAPGTRVTGCLVFASEQEKRPRPTYKKGGETIRAFPNRTALMRALRADACGAGRVSDLARRVWKLGKFEPTDQSVAAG